MILCTFQMTFLEYFKNQPIIKIEVLEIYSKWKNLCNTFKTGQNFKFPYIYTYTYINFFLNFLFIKIEIDYYFVK